MREEAAAVIAQAQVLEGLKEGDEVVLHPGDKVKEGVAIAPRHAN